MPGACCGSIDADLERPYPLQLKTCAAQDLCFYAQLLFYLSRYLSHTIEDENMKRKTPTEPTLKLYHAYNKPSWISKMQDLCPSLVRVHENTSTAQSLEASRSAWMEKTNKREEHGN